MPNGRPHLDRLAKVIARSQKVPPDLRRWFLESHGAMQAGASPVEAFGLTASREDRSRRNEFLSRAVEKMPAGWSAARRAARIVQAADRLAPFMLDPLAIEASCKPWESDVLRALRAAPMLSEEELRKLAGVFSKTTKNGA